MGGTSYITAANMRDGALYPYIDVPATGPGGVADGRVTAMGTAASSLIDSYCADHFVATSGGTILMRGTGRWDLPLSKRIRAITSVTLIDFEGTETAYAATYWRAYSSFDNVTPSNNVYLSPTGTDKLELRKELTKGNASGRWPVDPWMIQVVGDFDWATAPEEVVHACALIVWSWCTSDVPPGVESVDSATVRFTRPRLDSVADTLGIPLEAALLLQRFRRTQFGSLMRV